MDIKTATSLCLLVLLAVIQAVMASRLKSKQPIEIKPDGILQALMAAKFGYYQPSGIFHDPQYADLPGTQTVPRSADLPAEFPWKQTKKDTATGLKYEQYNDMSQTPLAAQESEYSKPTNRTEVNYSECSNLRCDFLQICRAGNVNGICRPVGHECRCVHN